MSGPLPFLGGVQGGVGVGDTDWFLGLTHARSAFSYWEVTSVLVLQYQLRPGSGQELHPHPPSPKPTSVSLPGGHFFPLNTVTHKVSSVSTSPTHSCTSAFFWLSAQLTGPGEH